MEALTRRHFRERIRHLLGKRTARDNDASAPLGDAASTHPHPTNALLNEHIDSALRLLNAECDLGFVDNIEISVEATTEDGAQRVSLRGAQASLYDAYPGNSGDIHSVKRAYLEIDSTLYPLRAADRAEYGRSRRQWETESAGVPRLYWIEGSDLYLLPGTDTDATLHLTAGTGIIGFTTDDDTLLQLPNDFHVVPIDLAAYLVAQSEPANVEMQTLTGMLRLKLWGDGREDLGGIGRIHRYKRTQAGELQASLYVRTGRVPIGRRG